MQRPPKVQYLNQQFVSHFFVKIDWNKRPLKLDISICRNAIYQKLLVNFFPWGEETKEVFPHLYFYFI